MSALDRLLQAVRDVLRMQGKVESLAGATKDLAGEVKDLNREVRGLDRRLVRIETLVEVAKAQGGGEGTPSLPSN